jgi:hypothetical protein
MATEQEKLLRDINGLKETIRLTWVDVNSVPMTPAERQEVRKSIDLLVAELDALRTKFVQLPKDTQT